MGIQQISGNNKIKVEHVRQYYLASILYGVLLKLVPVFILFIALLVYNYINNIQLPDPLFKAINQPTNIFKYFIYSIILAPLIENLLLLLASVIGSKTRDQWIVPSLLLSLIIYFAHGGAVIGIFAVIAFLGMYIQYQHLKDKIGKTNAYFCTVLTHASANIVTYAFIILRS